MKISQRKLKQIIKEEIAKALNERTTAKPRKPGELSPAERFLRSQEKVQRDNDARARAKPQDRMARRKAQRAAVAKHIEKVVIPKYLAKGYKRVNALPKFPGLKVGSHKVYRNSEVRTFKDFPIVLISLEPCSRCGAQWSTWNVDPHELESMVGDSRTTPPIAAVLVKPQNRVL